MRAVYLKGTRMKTHGAAALIAAAMWVSAALGLLAGCAADPSTSPGPTWYSAQDIVRKTFDLLDKMKAEGLVTPQQHEQLRQVLVKKMETEMPMAGNQPGDFYYYIANKNERLRDLRALQREGRITQAEYERIRETVLQLPKAPG